MLCFVQMEGVRALSFSAVHAPYYCSLGSAQAAWARRRRLHEKHNLGGDDAKASDPRGDAKALESHAALSPSSELEESMSGSTVPLVRRANSSGGGDGGTGDRVRFRHDVFSMLLQRAPSVACACFGF